MKNIRRYIISLLTLLSFAAVPAMAQSSSTDEETLKQNKTATYDYETHIGEITLESYVPGEMKMTQEAKAIEAIIVMDFSSSMLDSYSSSDSFSKTTTNKIYNAQNTYYQSGKNFKLLSTLSSDYPSKSLSTQIFDNKYNPIEVNYKGTTYYLNTYYTPDPNNSSYPYFWTYINVGNKRVFVRCDGSFIEENGNTEIKYNKFPTGTDGYFITPARGTSMTMLVTMKEETVKIIKRIDALRSAVGKFVDIVAEHAQKTGKTDRVSTVLFQASSLKYFPSLYGENSGEKPTNYITSTSKTYLMECPTDTTTSGWDSNITGKTYIGKRFIDMSTQDATKLLKFSISNSKPSGTTPINLGVDLAKRLMEKDGRKDNNVARYVIVFTDGEPTSPGGSSSDWTNVATPAVTLAYDLKNSSYPSNVYTVYCNSKNPSTTSNVYKFLDHLSSNYPSAKTYNDGTEKKDTKYFKMATDNLEDIFDEIAQEIIVDVDEKYDLNTTMKDFVNNNYFQYPENADEGDIKVYKQSCTGYTKGTGGAPDIYSFDSDLVDITSQVNVVLTRAKTESDKDLVEVYGFNYSDNWCGMDVTTNQPHGARLVIKFPFIFKGGHEVSGALKTNTEESGVYPVQKNEDGTPKVDENGKPIPEETTESKFTPPVILFNTLTITRKNLEAGETAIYEVTREGNFICRIALGGVGGKEETGISKTIYGLPGDEGISFTVTETNWNWAYHEPGEPLPSQTQIVKVEKTTGEGGQTIIDPVPLEYTFIGAHIEETDDKEPAERHNHGESFKVNRLKVKAKKDSGTE